MRTLAALGAARRLVACLAVAARRLVARFAVAARRLVARPPLAARRLAPSRGQATVETVALVPAMVAVGLGLMQLLAVGYAGVLAGSAAEAGALALANGLDARTGVHDALPAWSRDRTRVDVAGGRVEVRLRPPSVLNALSEELEVRAAAEVEAP